MRIALRHPPRAMSQQLSDLDQGHPGLNQPGWAGVPRVVLMEILQTRLPAHALEALLEARDTVAAAVAADPPKETTGNGVSEIPPEPVLLGTPPCSAVRSLVFRSSDKKSREVLVCGLLGYSC